jgi:hypothetical protein
LRIGLFDDNDILLFDEPCFDRLLLGRFQRASVFGLLSHPLNGIHYIALLR